MMNPVYKEIALKVANSMPDGCQWESGILKEELFEFIEKFMEEVERNGI